MARDTRDRNVQPQTFHMGGTLRSGARPGFHRLKQMTCSADDLGSDSPPETAKVWLTVSPISRSPLLCFRPWSGKYHI